MIVRTIKALFLSVLLVGMMVSCHTREVAYLSDAQRDSAEDILTSYTATILPGDILYIYVASQTPESVIPFNQESHGYALEVNSVQTETGSQNTRYVTNEVTGYTVSENGTIQFPLLGVINVVGMTHDKLCRHIESRLRDEGYVNDPQVTMKLMNFRVTVVGEVRTPKQVHADGTRLTIFEALALCGDITDYGQRTNVTIVRQEGGEMEIGEIDLTKKEMLDSPYYYLHNNDIVYVEPTHKRKVISDRDPNIPQYVSIAVSIANIVRTSMNISRNINRTNR